MSLYHSPRITTDGLVMCIDAANIKSFPQRPGQNEHGISDWVAMESGTASYSAIYPYTEIYEVDSNDIETLVVATGANPQRGTFSVTAGKRYYGTRPIHLIVRDGSSQHKLVPLSLAGTIFGYEIARNAPGTIFLYSLYTDATVNIYDDVVGGVNGTPTSTISVPRGVVTTFSVTTTGYVMFQSNHPIVASVTQSGADRMILPPASNAVYRTRNGDRQRTVTNAIPSTVTTYYVSDATTPVFAVEIGDGSGSDSAMHLALENMSDTYSFSEEIADFEILAPYPDTIVNVYYWSGSAWIVGEIFQLAGSLTNPAYVARDGDNGFGVAATNLTGTAAALASGATLWRFESNNPIMISFNDTDDDEETLLGWMSNSTKRKGSNQNIMWYDLSGRGRHFTVFGNPTFNSAGYFTLANNQTTQYMWRFPFETPTTAITYSCWFRSNFTNATQTPFMYSVNGNNEMLLFINNSTQLSFQPKGSASNVNTSSMLNTWVNIAWSRDSATGVNVFYRDGVQIGTYTAGAGSNITAGGHLIIGQEADAAGGGFDPAQNLDGDFSRLDVYDRVLSADEVRQNFNALRGRYGL